MILDQLTNDFLSIGRFVEFLPELRGVTDATIHGPVTDNGWHVYTIDILGHPSCPPEKPNITATFGIEENEARESTPERLIATLKARMFEALSHAFALIAENYQPTNKVYEAVEAAER